MFFGVDDAVIVLFSGALLAMLAGLACWFWSVGARRQQWWLQYSGLSLALLCGFGVVAVVFLRWLEQPWATFGIALFFNLPLLMIALVSGLIWRLGKKRQRRWLQYSGLSLFSLLLVLLIGLTSEWAKEVRHTVEIPGYRVEFFEAGGIDVEHFRYFYIDRPDGQRARYMIHNDTLRCFYLNVQPQGDRIYFQCWGEALTDASFVDRAKQTVYSNLHEAEESIADLEFWPADDE
ncbi:hypothetical protein IQ266_12845 [filamentous cyanobacterium LEGE 11480]|uniref:Uncharacterized protein n=1 Tax=Romeriopsis navalis LEGE 11480 TaxID=2777977 RepID=A0A928Z3F3_9CYAN|nr:hypothetical protein [Romeriopsis navalis]MBE9030619.1 hypothetical protein [Romeriopsis navalis LEGE 11480]